MGRSRNEVYPLKERLLRMETSGILNLKNIVQNSDFSIGTLEERLAKILNIVKSKPEKRVTMNYLIMYDIENNKVRTRVSKYLESKGCIRIQKSVFLVNTLAREFQEIYLTLCDVQSYYENEDSILLVPFNTSDIRSMKIIGKNLNIELITEKPSTLFF